MHDTRLSQAWMVTVSGLVSASCEGWLPTRHHRAAAPALTLVTRQWSLSNVSHHGWCGWWGDSDGAENGGCGSIVTNMVVAGPGGSSWHQHYTQPSTSPRGHQGGKLGSLGPVPQPPPTLPLAWGHLGWGVNWAKGSYWPSRGWAELWWSQWWGLDARQLDRGRDTRAGSCVPPQPITAQLCSHLAVSTNHSAALLSSLFTAESPPPAEARLVTPPWQETCALLKYEPSGHLMLWSHKQRFIYKQWTMKLIKVSVGLTSINSNPNQLHNSFNSSVSTTVFSTLMMAILVISLSI